MLRVFFFLFFVSAGAQIRTNNQIEVYKITQPFNPIPVQEIVVTPFETRVYTLENGIRPVFPDVIVRENQIFDVRNTNGITLPIPNLEIAPQYNFRIDNIPQPFRKNEQSRHLFKRNN